MSKLKIEIDLDDLVNDMFVDADIDVEDFGAQASPRSSFSQEVRDFVVRDVSYELKKRISDKYLQESETEALEVINKFIDSEMTGIITRKLRAGELRLRNGGFKSFDEMIENRIKYFDIEKVIAAHADQKAKKFAEDLKLRYDNIFAAKVVSNLADQGMLNPDIARILLGDK